MSISIKATLCDQNAKILETVSIFKGTKKEYIINEALEYYFNMIKTIPEEFIVKPLYITEKEFNRLESLDKPTDDLKKLFNKKGSL